MQRMIKLINSKGKSMHNNFWKGKKVLVIGGTGFIGSHVVEKLVEKQAIVSVLDNLQLGKIKNIDYLKDKLFLIKGNCMNLDDAYNACKGKDVVMNLAVRARGIEYNSMHQATMMRDNLYIGANMIEAARKADVERFLVVSSACVYPRNCSIPTPESEGFLDEPEPTNGGYGWAKRMAELLGKYYKEEFGMKVGIARPYNCYGPRDHFDPKYSNVIPALIRRVFNRENPVKVWGTGHQTRAFLYVEDCAEGLMLTIEKYPVADALNIGTDEEVTIASLIEKIIKISGVKTEIEFDTSKPDGSPRRNSDNRKALKTIGYKTKTRLDEGLRKTIAWYKSTHLK